MNSKMRNKIAQRFPRLRYLMICAMNFRNAQFRKKVIALANDPGIFFFERYGDLNPDKNICIVGMDDNYITQGGLMSELRNLLVRFSMCEHYGFIPVVEFRNSLYTMKAPMNGTTNAYEYFFEQPSSVSLSEAWNSKYVYVSRGIDALEFECLNQNYDISDMQIRKMGILYGKYIKLLSNIESIIEVQIQQLLDKKKTLGVHIRGGDFKQYYDRHPIPVSPKEYITPIRDLLENEGFEQVFLATDDKDAVKILRELFGRKLIFFEDVKRTDSVIGVHTMGYRAGEDGYQLGLEVLRDVYCLAQCHSLITGYSGAGLMAQVIKYSKGEKYEQKIILSNGFCDNGNQFPQRRNVKSK